MIQKFWWSFGATAVTPPTGQSPAGSRYRWNSRVSEIYYGLIIILAGVSKWSRI